MPITVAEAFVTLRPDLAGFGREVESGLGKSLASIGPKFQQAGTLLTAGLTVPIVGLGALASKASVSFESAFAGVRKTVDATDAQFGELRKGIREMSKEMPASAGEIAKVAEAAGQLGVKTENILAFAKVMVDLGETTNLTADQAATSMARIANIMQLPQDEFDRLGSTLVDLGNKGASTEAEIVEMALRIAGAGRQVGLSADQVLAFANSLSSVGIEAESGGSAISRTFIEIANAAADGGKELDAFAQVAGVSSAEFAQAFKTDAAGATITFIEGLKRISDEGGNVFKTLDDLGLGEIRVRDALLRASGAGDLFRQSLKDGEKAWAENTALTTEAGKRYETTAAKMEILRNKLNDVAITLGDALVPVLAQAVDAAAPLLKVITVMAEGFAKLPGPVQTGIVAILALVAVIGPLLFMIGGMATGFAALIAILAFVGISFAGGTIAVTGLALAFGTLTLAALPWIALAAAIAIAGYLIYKNWDKITAVLSSVANTVKDVLLGALRSVIDFLKGNWQTIALLISGPFLPLVALATDAFGIRSALINAFRGIASAAGKAFSSVKKVVTDNWREIAGILTGPAGLIAFNSFGIREAMVDAFNGALGAVGDGLNSIVSFIEQNFTAENVGSAFAWFLLWPVFLFKRAFDAVVPVLSTFFFSTLPAFFAQTIPALGASALALGSSIAKGIASGLRSDAAEIVTFIQRLPSMISSAAGAALAAATQLGSSIVNGIVSGLSSALGAVTTFLTSTLPGAIAGAAGSVGAAALKLGSSIIDGIVNGINGAMHLVLAAPGAIKDAFVGAASDAGRWLYEAGQAVVEGFWDGIKSLGGWLEDQAGGFFKGFVGSIKDSLGIKSPSTVMAGVGEDMMTGLARGIKDGGAEAEAATKQVLQKLRAIWDDNREGGPRIADAKRIAGEAGLPELGTAFERAQLAASKWSQDPARSAQRRVIGEKAYLDAWQRQMDGFWQDVETQGTAAAKDTSQGMTRGLADGINKGLDKDVKPAMANVRKTLAEVMATVDASKTLPSGSIDPIIQALPTLEAKLKEFQTQGTEPRFLAATTAYLESLKQSFASTTSVVEQMGPKLQASFANLGPQLQQSGVSAMQGFGAGLTSGVTAAVAPVAQTLDAAIIGAAAQGAATASVGGAQVGAGLAAGVQGGLQTLGPEFAAHLDAAVSAGAASAVPAATSAGVSIGDGVGVGMQSSDGPRSASAAMVDQIREALSVGGWGDIGRSVVEGVWEGMSSASGWLANMASNLFGNLKRSIENKLKAHSPAETMVPVGESIMQGVAKGMEQSYERDVKPLLATITGSLQERAKDALAKGIVMDWQGNLRPGDSGQEGNMAQWFAQGKTLADYYKTYLGGLAKDLDVRNALGWKETSPGRWTQTSSGAVVYGSQAEWEAAGGAGSSVTVAQSQANAGTPWPAGMTQAQINAQFGAGHVFNSYLPGGSEAQARAQYAANNALGQFSSTTGDASKTVQTTSSTLDGLATSAAGVGRALEGIGTAAAKAAGTMNSLWAAGMTQAQINEKYGPGHIFNAYLPGGSEAQARAQYAANNPPRLLGGMDWVPSDRFPAYLDRGERVLTAQENQAYSRGGAASDGIALNFLAPVTVNNKGPEDDVRKVMSDIGYAMQQDARLRGIRR